MLWTTSVGIEAKFRVFLEVRRQSRLQVSRIPGRIGPLLELTRRALEVSPTEGSDYAPDRIAYEHGEAAAIARDVGLVRCLLLLARQDGFWVLQALPLFEQAGVHGAHLGAEPLDVVAQLFGLHRVGQAAV